jgi:hypothetical protein
MSSTLGEGGAGAGNTVVSGLGKANLHQEAGFFRD